MQHKVNNNTIKDYHVFMKECFDNPVGVKVLEHLTKYAKLNFPNYENVYATYAKAGQQQMLDYIKGMMDLAKKETPKQ